jgi:TnpA family transposase
MLTADTIRQGEAFATVLRVRSPRVLLPADPSEEELARDFSLSGADKTEIRRCRGDEHRRRFALQLCVLRKTGRFLDSYRQVPTRILTHLSRQLDLSPVLFVSEAERSATEYDYQERIRQYLGWQSFDHWAEDELTRWLEMRAAEGTLTADLLQQAEGLLCSSRVVLPASSSLERLVASAAAQAQQAVFARIAEHLPSALRKDLDTLLNVAPSDYRSALLRLKEYPPEASAGVILAYVARYQQVHDLVANRIDLGMINPGVVRHLALLAKRYDVHALKRFAPAKRHAMLACFLVEAERSLLDHLVEMHDQYLTTMWRRARHAFEERHRQLRRRAREGVETVLLAIDILLATPADGDAVRAEVNQRVGFEHLREAAQSCREFQRLEERGQLDELCARYTTLRRYLPAFFSLPFAGEKGSEELLAALRLLRRLDAGKIEDLPKSAPCHFVPAAWRPALYRDDGALDRRVWVIALSQAVRDALRAGDVYLPGSRHHVSFWNLVYDEQRWAAERKSAYASLALPTEAETVLGKLRQEYTDAVGRAAGGLNETAFASMCDGRLQLKRADALEIPERTRQLRHAIETALPRVRIEQLLQEVDRHCGFTRELRPIGGYEPRLSNLYQSQLAALIAHGTNLGIAAMGQSAEGITADMLQHVSRFFLTDATLKSVNAVVVNFHHRLGFSGLWGTGSASSSDGQRFGIQASSLLASFYPRYFGYYERSITVYTHTSDQYSVFGTRAISCSAREALYVLDGLLENDTILRLHEHSTDTHGFTEQLFGLCYLLGYTFMPRLRDLADQQLYRVDPEIAPGALRPLLRAGLDFPLLGEQWDQLVRVAASLRNRVASAHVVLQRLANASPADRVAKALTTLGRIVKTIYILRYIHEEDLRRRVQLQLNRGESRHALARWLFFGNRGEFRSGDYEEIMNKASCLSLLSNAVLVWNTMAIMKIVTQLRAAGENVADEDLARVSPLMHQHVIPNGTYHFARSNLGDNRE